MHWPFCHLVQRATGARRVSRGRSSLCSSGNWPRCTALSPECARCGAGSGVRSWHGPLARRPLRSTSASMPHWCDPTFRPAIRCSRGRGLRLADCRSCCAPSAKAPDFLVCCRPFCGIVIALAVSAWWSKTMPWHVRAGVLAYAVLVLIVGQPFNLYWGIIVGAAVRLVARVRRPDPRRASPFGGTNDQKRTYRVNVGAVIAN